MKPYLRLNTRKQESVAALCGPHKTSVFARQVTPDIFWFSLVLVGQLLCFFLSRPVCTRPGKCHIKQTNLTVAYWGLNGVTDLGPNGGIASGLSVQYQMCRTECMCEE